MKLGGQLERLLCDTEKGSMWTRQSPVFAALSTPLWWTYTNSSWVFHQWRGLSRCQPSMRVSYWTVWNWVGANQVLHARSGEVSAKMKAHLHCINASVHIFLCSVAVMLAYECVSGNKTGACSRTWITKRPACILIIIAIIVIIEIFLLSSYN